MGDGRGVFWEGAVLRGRHKGFFGEVGGGNNVVCLKTRTLYLREKCLWGEGEFHGLDIEVFSGGRYRGFFRGGGNKVLREKNQSPESRVQSPESRVQSPGSRVQSCF